MTADDLGRWTTYLGASGWTVLDENGSALILTRSDNADSEARAVADTFNDLADEVRRLRDERDRLGETLNEAGKARSHAELRASQAETERDALREQCAMDDEGHRRVCGPAIEERDALRAVVADVRDSLARACAQRMTGWLVAELIGTLGHPNALVAPDPTSPTDTTETTR